VFDDNDLVAGAVERAVSRDPGLAWGGGFADPVALLQAVRAASHAVVLVDIDVPGYDAFELVLAVSAFYPAVQAVMLTGDLRTLHFDRATDVGARGYLLKSQTPAQILDAVKRAAAGEVVVSPEVMHWLRTQATD
jgi:DNA-binding NarL/FixJ family response regulator